MSKPNDHPPPAEDSPEEDRRTADERETLGLGSPASPGRPARDLSDLLRTGGALGSRLWDDLESNLGVLEPGTRLGRWEIDERRGQGGMATVYRAHRADGQFEQAAAVKVLRIAGRGLIGRFEQERQILAHLSHPSIARLLDGGITDDGLPYLVMELVDGRTLLEHCEERRLTLRQRVELFLEIVRAVELAHSHLIVHRDIKPQNILVRADGSPVLLDFGIAKLLETPDDAESVARTHTGARVMTPDYAAPEQILGLPITTATDVYQLGLLLYELLTGSHPFRVDGLSLRDAEQLVLERAPTPPSATVVRSGTTSIPVEGEGRPSARHLARRLRGDLDVIVLTCLRKEPERRYSSAAQLAEDLERHLASRPISARRDQLAYRFGRFVRRHRAAVATVAAAAVLLVTVTVGYLLDLRRARDLAEQKATTAERVTSLLTRLFTANDPYETEGAETDLRVILERAAGELETTLDQEPAVKGELLQVLGSVYGSIGEIQRAVALQEESLTHAERVGDPQRIADALIQVAEARRRASDLEGAQRAVAQVIALIDAGRCCEDRRILARAALVEAVSLRSLDQLDAAASRYPQALALYEESYGQGAAETLDARFSYGIFLIESGRQEDAVPVLEEVVDGLEAIHGPDHLGLAAPLDSLANALSRIDRVDEAESNQLRALALREWHLEPDHWRIAQSQQNLGILYLRKGDFERSLEHTEQARELYARIYGPRSREVIECLTNRANALTRLGRQEDAAETLRDALAGVRALHPPPRALEATIANNLASVEVGLGRYRAARDLLEQALALYQEIYGADSLRAAMAHGNLGSALVALGEHQAARPHLELTLRRYREERGERHSSVAFPLIGLGRMHAGLGDADAADAALAEALSIREEHYGADHEWVAETLVETATAMVELARWKPMRAAAERAMAIFTEKHGTASGDTLLARLLFARAEAELGSCVAAGDRLAAALADGAETERLAEALRAARTAIDRCTG
ncbi:MAG TPA: serine/threonine-protein kinase [Thermoanaerobaculia bacterium]|nr:serine/threonine-protein kinase [Thermoanaerobaculia bacterium]